MSIEYFLIIGLVAIISGLLIVITSLLIRIRDIEKMPAPWITMQQMHRLYSRYGKEAEEIMNIMRDKNHRIAGEDDGE